MAGPGALGVVASGTTVPAIARLRAIDWRFLLPVPPGRAFSHLLVLGGPGGVPARAQDAGLARRVSTELSAGGSADLVAAYADAPQEIRDIARAVAREGVLYLEVDRARRGVRATTPARVAAMLRHEGLTACAFYAMEPTIDDPRAFIPLDAPRAMTWHRRTSVGDRPLVRIANAVRHSAVHVGGPTVAALDRPYAVVAVAGERDELAPGALREPAVVQALGASRNPGTAVMLTYGGDRVLLFPFDDRSRAPVGVVKVTKAESLIDRTENEQARMHALRSTLEASLAAAIPEPLGATRVGRTMVVCERFMPGTPLAARAMDSAVALSEKIADLQMAAAWLARFHQATEIRRATLRESRTAFVDSLLASYTQALGIRDSASLTARLGSVADVLGGAQVAIATQHRDFAAWNILRSDAGLAVVDWEGAAEGVAAFDAVHLASTWLYSVRLSEGVNDEVRCVHELLDLAGRDAAASAARHTFMRYLEIVGIDQRLAPLLIALHRIELALRRETQRRLQGEPPETAMATIETRVVQSLAAQAARLFPSADA
jgi:hypothetical protein